VSFTTLISSNSAVCGERHDTAISSTEKIKGNTLSSQAPIYAPFWFAALSNSALQITKVIYGQTTEHPKHYFFQLMSTGAHWIKGILFVRYKEWLARKRKLRA